MEKFKERREEIGKEIEEIAGEIRVKKSYLKKIEEEDFSKLPPKVYTRGYIKEYAKFLGVSPDTSLDAYERYLKKENRHDEIADSSRPLSVNEDSETACCSLFSRSFSRKILWIVPLVAIIAIGIYLVFRGIEPDLHMQVQVQPQENHVLYQPKKLALPPAAEEIKPEKEIAVVAEEKRRLTIIATHMVWFQVVIDGIETREALLHPGERVRYEAKESFNLLIGNAGGVKLKFNGKEFRDLGEKGQVIRLILPVQTYLEGE
ncbi:DUF4115 domain-containing protein [Thermodesulfovibrionales bacterium]|nr:DUF4115 domain-containing protein [Thermodesulfovibrionales bacterium]